MMNLDPPRYRRILWILFGVPLFLLIAWLVLRFYEANDTAQMVADCRSRYSSAKTAAESALVDAHRPFLSATQVAAEASCGHLRYTGQLKP
jgi:hypothetical protein